MGLSCSCGEDYEWYYYPSQDFEKLNTKRRRRCISCDELINIGTDCLRFERTKASYYDVEFSIYGDEVHLSDKYMCKKCGEIFLNLNDLGYCLILGTTSMQEYLEEYWEMTGFTPKKEGEWKKE